ncbi:MAG TPA: DMT family transporter [Gemmatimonadales bacterium]|nr:DMT family transporter [Gemmatimonadales bacterium]
MVHLAMIAVQFFFASLTVVAKFVLPSISPAGIVFFRVAGAGLCFGLFQRFFVRERVSDRRDLATLAGLALLGVVMNQLLFLEGVKRTTAINTNILVTTMPVFTLAIALALGRERVTWLKVGGIALAALGAVYLIGPDRIRLDPTTAFGNALVACNTASYGAYLVLSKRMLERYRPVTVVSHVFLFGAVIVTPIGLLALRDVDLALVPARALWGLGYIVVCSSLLAYYLSIWALQRTASSLVAMYVYLQPVMTVVGAPLILGERLTPRAALAALVIFAGLALATWAEQRSGRALGAAFRPPAEGV